MRYQISGKQIDIGNALQTYVQDELNGIVQKYAERPTDANIIFSKSGSEFVCEATVHLSTGLTASAKGHAHEIHAAFDSTADKMEKQLLASAAEREASMASYRAELQALRIELESQPADYIRQRMKDLTGAP